MKDDPFDWWMPVRGATLPIPGAGPAESDTKPSLQLAAVQRRYRLEVDGY